ncbi:DNA repair exonuclease SbcCD nuclease subunit [Keratinibaculum paraultunense]|uniref:DNA repair exonuclease SbcCD nuclease subunit n=1 Tax=Keratinibaculum paraultunense TaxID=1278232 RepID=A0A4R3KXS4_9FIRM|nr:metallophosphoesterase [Keratinibaculum paraultunense]QQY80679.1 metallophosphoesterase [Keratinibaculum paraultunense]TCS89718.1 DNA repair exonuclease SbcCD nuclease subunit [Keratinibaculum paraultunense]
MRLLFITDTHIRGTTPKNRKDDLYKTLEKKILEVNEIVKKYDVDFLLHGGDLFDRPDVSVSVVGHFASMLNNIKVPIYTICGNHDIYGHNPQTIDRTMLGLLDTLNVVRIIKDEEKIFLNKNGVKVQLTGKSYTYNIDNEKNKSNYIVKDVSDDVDYSIHMVHGMLLNKPFIKGIPYTLIEDIIDTQADITLSGHYHSGFGIIKIDNKYFINPGSLIRITNSLTEIERMPKVVLINLNNHHIDVELIQLKSAAHGLDVLDRKEIEDHIFKSEKLFDFKQSIDTAVNFEKLEINEILMEVSNAEGVPEEVKKEALRRISNSQMKSLGDEF